MFVLIQCFFFLVCVVHTYFYHIGVYLISVQGDHTLLSFILGCLHHDFPEIEYFTSTFSYFRYYSFTSILILGVVDNVYINTHPKILSHLPHSTLIALDSLFIILILCVYILCMFYFVHILMCVLSMILFLELIFKFLMPMCIQCQPIKHKK